MSGVSHLGHVHLKVGDLDRAVDFYRAVLGLDVTERVGRYAFLSLGEHHHDLALQGLGGDEETATRERAVRDSVPGLYHAAWELDDAEALKAAYDRLQERGIAVAPVDQGISKALYFEDPAGNGVELYIDLREQRDVHHWDGQNERFDPESL